MKIYGRKFLREQKRRDDWMNVKGEILKVLVLAIFSLAIIVAMVYSMPKY